MIIDLVRTTMSSSNNQKVDRRAIIFIWNMIRQRGGFDMIKKASISGYSIAIAILLCSAAPSVAWAARAPHPFLAADVDGDGKKDGFFRIFKADRRVEIGVKLTEFHNKYVRIYVDSIKDFRESNFSIRTKRSLIEEIKRSCDEQSCPNYKIEAISILNKSISSEVVIVFYDASAKALCLDDKGKMTEAWYSD